MPETFEQMAERLRGELGSVGIADDSSSDSLESFDDVSNRLRSSLGISSPQQETRREPRDDLQTIFDISSAQGEGDSAASMMAQYLGQGKSGLAKSIDTQDRKNVKRVDLLANEFEKLNAAQKVGFGYISGGGDIASTLARPLDLVGMDVSDRLNRLNEEFSQAIEKADDSKVGHHGRGIMRSLTNMLPAVAIGGSPAAIEAMTAASAGLTSWNSSLTEGRDAGMSESKAHAYAALNGVIEGGVTYGFGKLLGGGAEGAVGKIFGKEGLESVVGQALNASKKGIINGIKKAGINGLKEIPEEGIIAAAQALNKVSWGLDKPGEFSAENIMSMAEDIIVQSMVMGGGMDLMNQTQQRLGTRQIKKFVENPSRSNAKDETLRTMAEGYGLNLNTKSGRKAMQDKVQSLQEQVEFGLTAEELGATKGMDRDIRDMDLENVPQEAFDAMPPEQDMAAEGPVAPIEATPIGEEVVGVPQEVESETGAVLAPYDRRAEDRGAEDRRSGATERRRFVSEEELGLKEMQAAGLDEDQIEVARKFGAFGKDAVTGWNEGRAGESRINTGKRLVEHVNETGEDASYGVMDIMNLGGLNKKLGDEGANKVYRDLSDIMSEEIGNAGGDTHKFRHGGDELSVFAAGVSQADMAQALVTAQERIYQYAKDNGLSDIIHPKHPGDLTKRGTGINFAVEGINQGLEQDDIKQVIALAGKRLESEKEATTYEQRTETERVRPEQPAKREAAEGTEQADPGTQEVSAKQDEEVSEVKPKKYPSKVSGAASDTGLTVSQFKEKFGESQAVDDDGKPVVVYHGTDAQFDEFDADFIEREDNFSFSDDKDVAGTYMRRDVDGAKIKEAYDKATPAQKKALEEELDQFVNDDGEIDENSFNEWAETANEDQPDIWVRDIVGILGGEPGNYLGEPTGDSRMVKAYLKLENPIKRYFDGTNKVQREVKPEGKPDGYIDYDVSDTNMPSTYDKTSTVYHVNDPSQIIQAKGETKAEAKPAEPTLTKEQESQIDDFWSGFEAEEGPVTDEAIEAEGISEDVAEWHRRKMERGDVGGALKNPDSISNAGKLALDMLKKGDIGGAFKAIKETAGAELRALAQHVGHTVKKGSSKSKILKGVKQSLLNKKISSVYEQHQAIKTEGKPHEVKRHGKKIEGLIDRLLLKLGGDTKNKKHMDQAEADWNASPSAEQLGIMVRESMDMRGVKDFGANMTRMQEQELEIAAENMMREVYDDNVPGHIDAKAVAEAARALGTKDNATRTRKAQIQGMANEMMFAEYSGEIDNLQRMHDELPEVTLLKDKIKDKKSSAKSLQEKKTAAASYIVTSLPKHLRGEFVKDVANVKTEKSLLNVMKKVDESAKQEAVDPTEVITESHKEKILNKARELGKKAGKKEGMAFKETLLKYARENLPASLVGKVTGEIERAKTLKSLEKALDKIDFKAAEAEHKGAVDRVKASIKNANKFTAGGTDFRNMYPHLRDAMQSLLDGVDTKKRSAALKEVQSYLESDEVRQDAPPELLQYIDKGLALVGTKNINDMTVAELNQLADSIDYILAAQKGMADQIKMEHAQEMVDVQSSIVDTIGKTKQDAEGKRVLAQEGIFRKIWNFIGENVESMTMLFDKGDNGPAQAFFSDQLHKARAKMSGLRNGLWDGFKKRLGMTIPSDWSHKLDGKTTVDTYELADGRTVRLTKAQKIYIHLLSQDAEGMDALLKSDGFVIGEPKKTGILGRYKENDSIYDAPLSAQDIKMLSDSMTKEELQAAEAIQKTMNEDSKKLINEATIDRYGFEMATKENYMRIFRYSDDVRQSATDQLMAEVRKGDPLENAGFLKDRTKSRAKLIIPDAFQVLGNHINESAALNAYLVPMRNIHAILNDPEVISAIKGKYGENTYKTFRDLIGRVRGATVKNSDERLWTKLRQNFAISTLALRPTTWVAQTLSYPDAGLEVGYENLAKSLSSRVLNNKEASKNIDAIINNSETLKARFSEGLFDRDLASLSSVGELNYELTGKTKARDKLGTMIQKFDQLTVRGIILAAHMKAKAEGKGLDYATDLAEKAVRRTQPTFSQETRTRLGGTKSELIKSMTMFRSYRDKALINLTIQSRKNGVKSPQFAKAVGQIVLFNALTNAMRLALYGLARGKTDEEDFGWEVLNKAFSSMTGLMPFAGDVIGKLTSNFDRSAVNAPVADLIDQSVESVEDLGNSFMQWSDDVRYEKSGKGYKKGDMKAPKTFKRGMKKAIGASRLTGVPVEGVIKFYTDMAEIIDNLKEEDDGKGQPYWERMKK